MTRFKYMRCSYCGRKLKNEPPTCPHCGNEYFPVPPETIPEKIEDFIFGNLGIIVYLVLLAALTILTGPNINDFWGYLILAGFVLGAVILVLKIFKDNYGAQGHSRDRKSDRQM